MVDREIHELKFCITKSLKTLKVISGKGCLSDIATTVGKLKSRANGSKILQARAERAKIRICLKISTTQLQKTIIEKSDTSTDYFTKPTFGTWNQMTLKLTYYFCQIISFLSLKSPLYPHYHHILPPYSYLFIQSVSPWSFLLLAASDIPCPVSLPSSTTPNP